MALNSRLVAVFPQMTLHCCSEHQSAQVVRNAYQRVNPIDWNCRKPSQSKQVI